MRHQNRSSKLRWTSTLLSLCLFAGAIGESLGAPHSGRAQSTPPHYDRLLAHQGRSDALRQTQLAFLHSANYAHPYYWAAFVPSGDWRSLP